MSGWPSKAGYFGCMMCVALLARLSHGVGQNALRAELRKRVRRPLLGAHVFKSEGAHHRMCGGVRSTHERCPRD